ncbi:hypothetical protein APSETT444_001765 [Aspergillus pseudonomiae]
MVTNVEPQEDAERPLLADSPEPSYEAVAAPTSASDVAPRATFRRNLGAMEAFGIVISIVIGSGVFTSPGAIDTNVPSPGAALIVWLVGGLLAWTGATTMAELGTAISGEGGVQPYLQYAFGDILGFLAAWTWIIAVMPATLAILSIVFIESIYSAAGITNQASSIQHKLLSILVLIAIGVANSISTKVSTRLSSFFVTTKFATITGIVLAGLLVVLVHLSSTHWDGPATDWYTKSWFGYRDSLTPDGKEIHWSDLAGWEMLGHYSAALYGALWAYSGWDKAGIPDLLREWNRPVAGVIAAVLICLVVAGSLLGNSFVAGRMIVAASNSNWLPRFLGILGRLGATSTQNSASALPSDLSAPSGKSDAPINAIVLSTALPIFYILFGDFRALLTFNGLGEYTFFLLTVLGAIILRFREPDLHRLQDSKVEGFE